MQLYTTYKTFKFVLFLEVSHFIHNEEFLVTYKLHNCCMILKSSNLGP